MSPSSMKSLKTINSVISHLMEISCSLKLSNSNIYNQPLFNKQPTWKVDSYSKSLLRDQPYDPISVSADGNCLFNSVSMFLAGNESLSTELRVRTAIELAYNRQLYLRQPNAESFNNTADFDESLLDCVKEGGYSSIWTICALSTVIKRKIISVYPDINGNHDIVYTILNVMISPITTLRIDALDSLKIMWTRAQPPINSGPSQLWTPNHFVPLIQEQMPPYHVVIEDEIRDPEQVFIIFIQDPHEPDKDTLLTDDQQSNTILFDQPEPQILTNFSDSTLTTAHNTTPTLVEARQGGIRLVYCDYIYVREKKYKNMMYWRCLFRTNCTGRLRTSFVSDINDIPIVMGLPSQHSHPPNTGQVIRDKTIHTMRKELKANRLSPLKRIYSEVAKNTVFSSMNEQLSLFPSYSSMRTILQRERYLAVPKLPKCRADIVLDGEWKATIDGENFLLPSYENDLLIFTTDSNLKVLAKCEIIYVDGTFKSCPILYKQLYSVHGLYKGFVLPLIFSLLPDKSSATYFILFGRIKEALANLKLGFTPLTIVSDFELGLIETVKFQFPYSEHLGCHFHFGQSIFRKVQDTGLAVEYRQENSSIRSYIEFCIALAFVPENEVIEQFSNITDSLTDNDRNKLRPFIDYFQSTWINGTFSVKLWNKYRCDKFKRTNNAMESWHSSLKRVMPRHPNIFTFINIMKEQQALTKIAIFKAEAGSLPPTGNLKYNRLNEKIIKLHEEHYTGKINTAALLRKIKHCVNTAKK